MGLRLWLTKRMTRHRIRSFVRRCTREGVIVPPVLDAGAGYRSNFHEIRLEPYCTLDTNPALDPDVVGDVCEMTEVEDGSFNTVVCTEVFEHVTRPFLAIEEFRRVLAPGGKLVLTVPFWYPIHESPYNPNDYWRFTPRGILSTLEAGGFDCGECEVRVSNGGIRPTGVFVIAEKR